MLSTSLFPPTSRASSPWLLPSSSRTSTALPPLPLASVAIAPTPLSFSLPLDPTTPPGSTTRSRLPLRICLRHLLRRRGLSPESLPFAEAVADLPSPTSPSTSPSQRRRFAESDSLSPPSPLPLPSLRRRLTLTASCVTVAAPASPMDEEGQERDEIACRLLPITSRRSRRHLPPQTSPSPPPPCCRHRSRVAHGREAGRDEGLEEGPSSIAVHDRL